MERKTDTIRYKHSTSLRVLNKKEGNAMNAVKFLFTLALAAGLLLFLAGCPGEDVAQKNNQGNQKTSLLLDLSSIPMDSAGPSGASTLGTLGGASAMGMTPMAREVNGELLVVEDETGNTITYSINITLDEAVLSLTTSGVYYLNSGPHHFYLLLNLTFNEVTHQYAAMEAVLIGTSGSNTVELTLYPLTVFEGETPITKAIELKDLTALEFSYPDDISTFTDPRFGFSKDGSQEYVFIITNKEKVDGSAVVILRYQEFYVIEARFYDGEVIKDVTADPEVPGTPPGYDPTPVPVVDPTAQTTYSFTDSGDGTGTAKFWFPIPPYVTSLVDNGDDTLLSTRLATNVSVASGGWMLASGTLPYETIDGVDGGSLILSNFTPGSVTWSIQFMDLRPGKEGLIGYCASTDDVSVDVTGTYFCNLNLVNQEIVTDYPVGDVNITVTDLSALDSGVVILVNGEPAGITNSNGGLLQIFLEDGAYTFQAVVAGREPSAEVTGTVVSGLAVDIALELPAIPDLTPPGAISGLTAIAGDSVVVLQWSNPGDGDLAGVRIVRSLDSAKVLLPAEGLAFWDMAAGASTFSDTTVSNGTPYFYTLFAFDGIPNYSGGVQSLGVTPMPPPPEVPDSIVLTATRVFKPRVYIAGEMDWELGEGEAVTVTIPGMDAVQVLAGDPEHFLLFVYLGDVKCMYLGGHHDRYLGGNTLWDDKEIFEKSFKSPVCGISGESGTGHLSEGDSVTTFGPIHSKVITGSPHEQETTVEITIPVVSITTP